MKNTSRHIVLAACVRTLLFVGGSKYRDRHTSSRLTAIETYLHRLSPRLCKKLDAWSSEHNWPTWLCGPTSYALARELNRRFFDNELPIVGTPTGGDYIQVKAGIFRKPIGGWKYEAADHAWIEIHWRGLIIFVDPTYSKIDNLGTISFAWFDVDKDVDKRKQFMELMRLADADAAKAPPEIGGDVDWITAHLDAGLPPREWLVWARKLDQWCFIEDR